MSQYDQSQGFLEAPSYSQMPFELHPQVHDEPMVEDDEELHHGENIDDYSNEEFTDDYSNEEITYDQGNGIDDQSNGESTMEIEQEGFTSNPPVYHASDLVQMLSRVNAYNRYGQRIDFQKYYNLFELIFKGDENELEINENEPQTMVGYATFYNNIRPTNETRVPIVERRPIERTSFTVEGNTELDNIIKDIENTRKNTSTYVTTYRYIYNILTNTNGGELEYLNKWLFTLTGKSLNISSERVDKIRTKATDIFKSIVLFHNAFKNKYKSNGTVWEYGAIDLSFRLLLHEMLENPEVFVINVYAIQSPKSANFNALITAYIDNETQVHKTQYKYVLPYNSITRTIKRLTENVDALGSFYTIPRN